MRDSSHTIAQLLKQDRRYHYDAYVFVFDALQYAQRVLGLGRPGESEPLGHEDEEPSKPERHVSGQELCEAIRRYALGQYGYMAKTVLNNWGIHCTGDFGEIVFNLIRAGEMRKTRQDRREDFDDVFDFERAFREEFRIIRDEEKDRR